MNFRKLNNYIAAAIFAITLIMYAATTQSSVAFWDCGEFAATAFSMEVPHPPGAPLFSLLGRVAMMTPVVTDPGFRINLLSALASALTIMFMYLIAVRLVLRWKEFPTDLSGALTVFGASAIGALLFSVTDTFWFNAVESEVYALSMFFVSSVVWLGLVWYEKADEPGNERYLLLIAYMMGLSIGIHQLSLLAYFTVAMFVYFRYNDFEWKKFFYFGVITVLSFGVIYPVIVEWLPGILDGDVQLGPIHITESFVLKLLPLALVMAAIYGIYRADKQGRKILNVSLLAALLVVLGYSTYTLILVRANSAPPINENNPSTLTRLVGYLNREQYGEQPSIFKRRWDTNDPAHVQNYQKYSSDWDFFASYQVNHMFLRYLGWNFVGRAGDIQDAPIAFTKAPTGWFDGVKGYPARYFGIPLLIALFGLWYHFKKDWKFGLAFLTLFVVMGPALAVYFNMAEPQPRERDYFFVGAFFVLALWVGIGVTGLLELAADSVKDGRKRKFAIAGLSLVFFLVLPFNMFAENVYSHDRSGNYVPFDYSYNILQSCKKNAILFTNGDNDTFPLWYLQEVMGVRTDVRIVNLSLSNTPWYILQLKNETPHGALKVPISLSDQTIERLVPVEWKPTKVRLPVSPEVYEEFGVTDTAVTNSRAIEFMLNPTIGGGQISGIRTQDILVRNILETNNWERPVYFSVTVANSNFIGLDNFLEMQGMALQVMPFRQQFQDGQYKINAPIMKECLFKDPGRVYTDPHYGFRFTNLDNPRVYYDDNARRLTLNYRNPFMRLAIYYLQTGDTSSTISVLDRMEKVAPIDVVPMDYRILSDVARIYYMAGARDRYAKYSAIVEKDALAAIERDPMDVRSAYNPYRILLDIYETSGKYQKEVDILTKLQGLFPNERSLQVRISELQSTLSRKKLSEVDSLGK
jgi:Protein O-mannosyl-transferase TMEM260-like